MSKAKSLSVNIRLSAIIDLQINLNDFCFVYLAANGYTYVKIHIGGVNTDGQNIDQYSRSLLEGLKADAARLMFVPPEHVVIAGIEPSNSLLITLMIQTEHVRYLKKAAEGKDCIREWVHFGVDFITIGGEDYFLTGN